MTALDVELRYGYTLAALHRLARLAALGVGARAADFQGRYDTAYSAIAEHLYTAEHPPREHNLITVGRAAILDEEREAARSHGQIRADESAPRFVVYWEWAARTTPSPETRVVERVAISQILATLPPTQYASVQARAAFPDQRAAAAALGVNVKNFCSNLRYARTKSLALWHEGETPSRVWQRDQVGGEKSRTARRVMRTLRERTGATRPLTPSPDLIPVELDARCGSLTVIEARRRGAVKIRCRCDCGTEREFVIANLRRGNSQSCGCPQGRAAAAERNRAKQALVPGGGNYPRTRSAMLANDRRVTR